VKVKGLAVMGVTREVSRPKVSRVAVVVPVTSTRCSEVKLV